MIAGTAGVLALSVRCTGVVCKLQLRRYQKRDRNIHVRKFLAKDIRLHCAERPLATSTSSMPPVKLRRSSECQVCSQLESQTHENSSKALKKQRGLGKIRGVHGVPDRRPSPQRPHDPSGSSRWPRLKLAERPRGPS